MSAPSLSQSKELHIGYPWIYVGNGPSLSALTLALSERILRSNSATDALESWCKERSIGDGRIAAHCVRDAAHQNMDDESLDALRQPHARKDTSFRRARLATAGIVVADALNWFFPDRLTAEMRDELEATDIPFGRVIAPLRLRRRTFLVRRYMCEATYNCERFDPHEIAFEHRAVVHREDATPLAVVHERFLGTLLLCHADPSAW